MAIDLKPEQQRVIDFAIGSGAYRNSDEVLDQAFRIIQDQLDLKDDCVVQLHAAGNRR